MGDVSPRKKRMRSHTKRRKKGMPSTPLIGKNAVAVARRGLEELGEGAVGEHIGVQQVSLESATHRFAAEVPGYDGWEWNAVVACVPGSKYVTLSEVALVLGGSALQPPRWVPYHERVRPGDLGPNDVMPPRDDDPRLTADERTAAMDFGTTKKLSKAGLNGTKVRWQNGAFGPQSEYAEKAKLPCYTCAFYVPMTDPVGNNFGVCTNEYSADGHIVHSRYGCGAHTDTPPVEPLGVVELQPFDDEHPVSVDTIS
ncbi:DUF3027 domain-containing protein [Corynebacterium diphtheriae]|uniref:DUF3027 domain-containing protein n=1 Tax=Corynebacterium diphtheriae TaxID=1717 RepID=UPI0015F5EEAF|nr:DUF3027 domain-containing protein [Corynebacterium diphtheriae]